MRNPGVYSLTQNDGASDLAIAAAATTLCDVIAELAGLAGVTLQARLAVGTAGTSVKVYIQTSLDQGTTWIDVACLAFTTASATKAVNLTAATPKTTPVTPTDGSLANDTVVDGILGDRLRAKVVSVGIFADTVLAVRAAAR